MDCPSCGEPLSDDSWKTQPPNVAFVCDYCATVVYIDGGYFIPSDYADTLS